MSEERKKILEMLAAGKITAEEAERLLDKVEATPSDEADTSSRTGDPKKIKYLRVLVDGAEGDKVNVRVPINLIRTGIKLSAVLPIHASKKLDDQGLDLNGLAKMADEDLVEALADLQVDVDSSDGEVVRVFCE
jgi:hypothetical protein